QRDGGQVQRAVAVEVGHVEGPPMIAGEERLPRAESLLRPGHPEDALHVDPQQIATAVPVPVRDRELLHVRRDHLHPRGEGAVPLVAQDGDRAAVAAVGHDLGRAVGVEIRGEEQALDAAGHLGPHRRVEGSAVLAAEKVEAGLAGNGHEEVEARIAVEVGEGEGGGAGQGKVDCGEVEPERSAARLAGPLATDLLLRARARAVAAVGRIAGEMDASARAGGLFGEARAAVEMAARGQGGSACTTGTTETPGTALASVPASSCATPGEIAAEAADASRTADAALAAGAGLPLGTR